MERYIPKHSIIPLEAIQRACEMFVRHFGQTRSMIVTTVEEIPELNIPDGTIILLNNRETDEMKVEYLPRTMQPKKPPSPKQQ